MARRGDTATDGGGTPGAKYGGAVDTFTAIAEERHRVADFLEGLDDSAWATPSCCKGWTIREVAAHLLVGPMMGMKGSLPFIFRAAGRPNKANDLTARHLAKMEPSELLAKLREHAEDRFVPPGFPPEAPLVDVTIHGQDMTRPLGVDLGVPVERWTPALEAATSPRYAIISARGKLKGLSFASTDTGFGHGKGPLVEGNARDLAHAMLGRVQALDALSGDGVDVLRSRLA